MRLTGSGLVYGGRSGEHEISLRSAESIHRGAGSSKYEVKRIFITKEGRWEPGPILPEPGANPGIDVVFPVLHGTFGEDGTVQGLLRTCGLALRGRGRARVGGVHGQGSSPSGCCASAAFRWRTDYRAAAEDFAHRRDLARTAVSDVRQAGESGLFRRDFQSEDLRGTGAGA